MGHGRAPKARPRRGAAGFRGTPERAVPTRIVDCCRMSHRAPSVTRRIMRRMAWREARHMRVREADVAHGVERVCIMVVPLRPRGAAWAPRGADLGARPDADRTRTREHPRRPTATRADRPISGDGGRDATRTGTCPCVTSDL